MSVQIKYNTPLGKISERIKRSNWFRERIPTEEYHIAVQLDDEDELEIEDLIETVVTIWADDADKIATEYWFRFP